jgi:hypothetical protein
MHIYKLACPVSIPQQIPQRVSRFSKIKKIFNIRPVSIGDLAIKES